MNDKRKIEINNELPKYHEKFEKFKRLDEFYLNSGISNKFLPSKIFIGALEVQNKSCKYNNPDWMAQSAHSLREIIYPFLYKKKGSFFPDKIKEYGGLGTDESINKLIEEYYGFFTSIAHHLFDQASKNKLVTPSRNKPVVITPEIFSDIVEEFENLLFDILTRQLDIHKQIDQLITKDISEIHNSDEINQLIIRNNDSYRYFFSNVKPEWVNYLWQNGYLDVIKKQSDDPKMIKYQIVELNYLLRISEAVPNEVTNIILSNQVATNENNFNPEVINKFIRIIGKLPKDCIEKIIPKIKQEKWIMLMGGFSHWGMEYEDIIEKLLNKKSYKHLLELFDCLLTIKEISDIDQEILYRRDIFYFDDFKFINLFPILRDIEDSFLESSIKLLSKKIIEIGALGKKNDDGNVFEVEDINSLSSTNFFNLSITSDIERETFSDMVFTFIGLIERAYRSNIDNSKEIIRIYNEYIKTLPNSALYWRLSLYVLSIFPNIFIDEIKEKINKIFQNKEKNFLYYFYGAEFHSFFQTCFKYLDNEYQRNFISQIYSIFIENSNKNYDRERFIKEGRRLFSCIREQLTEEEKAKYLNTFEFFIEDFKPSPMVKFTSFGTVSPKAPISKEKFESKTVNEIINILIDEWNIQKLSELNRNQDFLTPINIEGVGKLLQEDVKERFI